MELNNFILTKNTKTMKTKFRRSLMLVTAMFLFVTLVPVSLKSARACEVQIQNSTLDEGGPKVHRKNCNGECNYSGSQCRIR